ncbi:hypothetical protein GcM3_223002 [Golovinomyces cichoracearum]|uniref:Uncharacterized protein n=1 Tax=Golovinomyces cichoracearum TaxID=62708 RepID=A0A420H1Z2_9PEZI|nr:hypothetical protein GcM3_223002 [Golovinomyces cichoracearum]
MGLIWKNLLPTPSTKRDQQIKKTQGYSYDLSRPSSPPIRGKSPYLGNRPIKLSGIAIRNLNQIQDGNKFVDTLSDSTTTFKCASPDDFQVLHRIDSWSSASSDPSNRRKRLIWRSSLRDIRSSRPNTSTSYSSGALRRPLTERMKDIKQQELQFSDLLSKKMRSSVQQNYSIDLLEAYKTINPSKEVLQAREQAIGMRNYGEDVANRNMTQELKVENLENAQELSTYTKSPELKFAKVIHLVKDVANIIDADQPSSQNNGNKRITTPENLVKPFTHSSSYPLQSFITRKNDPPRPTTASARLDITKIQPSPESVPFVHKKVLEDDEKSSRNLDNSKTLPDDRNTPLKARENEERKENEINLRRHSLSASASPKFTPCLDQDGKDSRKYLRPLTPCIIKTSITASPKLKSKDTFLRRFTDEPENVRPSTGDKDTMTKGTVNNIVKYHSAIKLERNNFNILKRARSNVSSKSLEHGTAQQQPLRRNIETSSLKENLKPSTCVKGLNPIIEETFSTKNPLYDFKVGKKISRPKSRHEILQVPQDTMAASAPIIPFNRNQLLYQSQNYSLTGIQVDNIDSTDLSTISITRKKKFNHRNSKDGSQKPTALFRSASKGKLSPKIDNLNNYIKNEIIYGTPHVWNSSTTARVNRENLENFYGVDESSAIRPTSFISYYDSDDSDFFNQDKVKSTTDGEELLFGDICNFGGMLPGLWIKHPVSGTGSSLGSPS